MTILAQYSHNAKCHTHAIAIAGKRRKTGCGRYPLTSGAYFDVPMRAEDTRIRARHALGQDYTVSIHADLVKIKSNYSMSSNVPLPKNNDVRGEISGFSAASRKRLIEFMACVRYDTQLVFLTLTYPDKFSSDTLVWKAHFEAFRRRFERKYPQYRAIWRLEIKQRKSGTNKGQDAPHFHLMIFTNNSEEPNISTEFVSSHGRSHEKAVSPLSKDVEKWASAAWTAIVDGDSDHSEHGAFAVAVRNRRHAYKYISKYVAKMDDDTHAVGRRWGRIGDFDTLASRVGTMSQAQYIQFRRLVRGWLKARGSTYAKHVAQSPPSLGMSTFGLGDAILSTGQHEDMARTVYRMIVHAGELADDPVYWLPSSRPPAYRQAERYRLAKSRDVLNV